ncbi:hypothetical protein ACLOJK_021325 [Asimina triloba]
MGMGHLINGPGSPCVSHGDDKEQNPHAKGRMLSTTCHYFMGPPPPPKLFLQISNGPCPALVNNPREKRRNQNPRFSRVLLLAPREAHGPPCLSHIQTLL